MSIFIKFYNDIKRNPKLKLYDLNVPSFEFPYLGEMHDAPETEDDIISLAKLGKAYWVNHMPKRFALTTTAYGGEPVVALFNGDAINPWIANGLAVGAVVVDVDIDERDAIYLILALAIIKAIIPVQFLTSDITQIGMSF